MNTKKASDILICFLWWMTISLVFPFQAKKRGLVKRRWVRILLTLLSPAAVITYLLAWGIWDMGRGAELDPADLIFSTRDDIVLLTGIHDLSTIELKSCWRDPWEGTEFARFEYAEAPSADFFSDLEKRSADEEDIYWKPNPVSGYDFERGWYAGPMEKPSEAFPDNVSVRVHFSEKGVSVQYDYQPFVFKGLCTQQELTERTGVAFPPFEIIDYCWHPVGPDAVAKTTLRLQAKPGRRFIKELKSKWSDTDSGCYVWRDGDYDPEGIPQKEYTILVEEGSRFVTIHYASY